MMFQVTNNKCSICKKVIHDSNLPAYFPNYVCDECDERAVLKNGGKASEWHRKNLENLRSQDPFHYKDTLVSSETGPNPVFIDGCKCWRRYRLGSWVTMKDVFNSWSLEEFEINNFSNGKK